MENQGFYYNFPVIRKGYKKIVVKNLEKQWTYNIYR